MENIPLQALNNTDDTENRNNRVGFYGEMDLEGREEWIGMLYLKCQHMS